MAGPAVGCAGPDAPARDEFQHGPGGRPGPAVDVQPHPQRRAQPAPGQPDPDPAETFDLLCRACALTHRERDVVAALVAGLDTRAVTERLVISRHTVQDHLKSVFEKVGVRSRRELLATFSAPGAAPRSERSNRL